MPIDYALIDSVARRGVESSPLDLILDTEIRLGRPLTDTEARALGRAWKRERRLMRAWRVWAAPLEET